MKILNETSSGANRKHVGQPNKAVQRCHAPSRPSLQIAPRIRVARTRGYAFHAASVSSSEREDREAQHSDAQTQDPARWRRACGRHAVTLYLFMKTNSSAPVGCTAIVESKCALVTPVFMATATIWINSAASGPNRWQPTTRSLCLSTTSLKTRFQCAASQRLL